MMAEDLLKKRLGIQSGISSKMKEALLKWKKAYINESSWIKDDVESLELPASISSEIARLVTIESTITFSDGVRANFLSKQLDYFRNQKKEIVEMACAIGGMYFKPYVNNGKVIIDYIYQDEAIPFRFDSEKRITGVGFHLHRSNVQPMHINLHHLLQHIQNYRFYTSFLQPLPKHNPSILLRIYFPFANYF